MTRNEKSDTGGGKSGIGPVWARAVGFFAVWLLLSGKYDLFHMGAGLLAVGILLALDRRLGLADLGENDLPVRVHPVRALAYFPWLAWQMLLSSYDVAKVVLHPSMPIHPRLIRFSSKQPHTVARVVLGNSITLTPGTLTLDIEGDRYLIHALSEGSKEGLVSGDMQKRVARLFSADESRPVFDVAVDEGRGERRRRR